MMRGSDSTTARSSTRPPMVAGPMLRNFKFFRTALGLVCAIAVLVKRVMRVRVVADFMTVSLNGSHSSAQGGAGGEGSRRLQREEVRGGRNRKTREGDFDAETRSRGVRMREERSRTGAETAEM